MDCRGTRDKKQLDLGAWTKVERNVMKRQRTEAERMILKHLDLGVQNIFIYLQRQKKLYMKTEQNITLIKILLMYL